MKCHEYSSSYAIDRKNNSLSATNCSLPALSKKSVKSVAPLSDKLIQSFFVNSSSLAPLVPYELSVKPLCASVSPEKISNMIVDPNIIIHFPAPLAFPLKSYFKKKKKITSYIN